MSDFDYVVVGGGSAGLTAAIMAGELGASVLLVDKEKLGGDCLHYGCVPSKSLIASAKRAYQARNAAVFGVHTGEVQVNFGEVMQRIRSVQDAIAESESVSSLKSHGVEVAFGKAEFVDATHLKIGTKVVSFRFALIATGAHSTLPPIKGLADAKPLSNETLWSLTSLPNRMAVIGGGPIGVELGQALHRLGAKVTIFERGDRILSRADSEASTLVLNALRHEGIQVHLNAKIESAHRTSETVEIEWQQGSFTADEFLVATSRQANTSGLALEKAGVETNSHGIVVSPSLQTTQKNIYAAGDCTGGPQFTHWAEYEARVATRNALFRGNDERKQSIVPAVTFCDPEVAQVGLTFAQAKARKIDATEHRVPMNKVDRALCDGHSVGFAKVIVDSSDHILGVHLVGSMAGESLTEWVLAMEQNISFRDVGASIHSYPTYARINRRLADERFLSDGISSWKKTLFGRF